MCAVKQTSIVFFRCVYDVNGAHPDPEKVSTVHKMLAPKTATQLQKFLRLVTYPSPFIPSLSSFSTLLLGLMKKGTEFFWNNSYQEAFDKVKSMVCNDTTLWYLHVCKPVTLKVSASQKAYVLPSFKMAAQLPLLPKPLHLWSSTMPTQIMNCSPVSLE